MDRGSYIAGTGMVAQQQRLDVLANNLANVNTTGFKADRLTFSDMLNRRLADKAGYGAEIGTLSSGPNADAAVAITDFTEGGAQVTGNPLDLRLANGNPNTRTVAMFAVSHNGETRYTRNGSMTLDTRGTLMTRTGDTVLDDTGKPITGLSGRVEVRENGTVEMNGKPVAKIGLAVGTFSKDRDGQGLYRSADARNANATDAVRVAANELETSNVNPVLAMVEMISLQRSFEMAQKMVQNQDESTAKLAETMS